MSAELQFADLKGDTLVKTPGSINGEAFVLRNLEDCSVYILDYTSEVDVSNCVNCQIFIAPVDGPAIFTEVVNCQVAVACQQFQAKGCRSVEFGLFCATQPSITACSGIRIACWAGAYPGLTEHFAAANLDPNSNHWSKVYDASEEDGSANFDVVLEAVPWWEVPLEGAGPPDNPVPGADGSRYVAPPAAPGAAFGAMEGGAGPAAAASANGHLGGLTDDFLAAGGVDLPPDGLLPAAASAPAGQDVEHPAVTEAKEATQQRMAEQAKLEADKKSATQAAASTYLQEFYERRAKTKEERIRLVREAAEGTGGGELGPVGAHPWERTISLINFNLSKPGGAGADLSRFKSVLFGLKAKEAGAD